MPSYGRKIDKELKHCAANIVSDCGLTQEKIQSLAGNPAGITKQDFVNPHYVGKITVASDTVTIKLSVKLSGHVSRAKAAIKNIQKVFAAQKVIVELPIVTSNYDLLIHGASISEFASGLKSCSCEGMLAIGGWGPHYSHQKWGKALLLNPHSPRHYWKMTDAHEFGHKLGLRHRGDLGIMDYWNEKKYRKDPRKFIPSDKSRAIVKSGVQPIKQRPV